MIYNLDEEKNKGLLKILEHEPVLNLLILMLLNG